MDDEKKDWLTGQFKTVDDFLAKLYTYKEDSGSIEKMQGVDLVYAVVFAVLDDLPMKMLEDSIAAKGGPPGALGTDDATGEKARFEAVDKILRKADPAQMRDTISLCLLSTTLGCKDKLVERKFYLERCKRRYLKTGSRARAKRLLNGLS